MYIYISHIYTLGKGMLLILFFQIIFPPTIRK